MAFYLSFTLLTESKWPRAAFHLLPTLSYNCSSFLGKIFCCVSVKTLWCCFLWKWVQGRSEGSSPALLNAREVWTPPVFPGHGVFGQTTLLDCSFAWPWRKLTLGQGAQGRPRLGLGAETASAHLLISRLPLRTRCLCSLVCKAQPVRACLQHSWCFGFLLLFFGVVNGLWSCRLSRYSSLQTDH